MTSNRRPLSLACLGIALSVAACGEDGSQAPPARADVPLQQAQTLEAGNLAPLDLVYVCGNKFLATNSTRGTVQVTYRVVGASETGGLTLPPGTSRDPGHSETEMETGKQGTVELYRDDQRVAIRRNLKRLCGVHAAANLASATAAESGSWTAPVPWPIVALHASVIPDGRVLAWGLTGSPQIWDPATGQFTEVASSSELFCSGHSLLSDGRLMVSGGHISADHGIPDISVFSPATGSWTKSTSMRRGRWYPTNTTLANGSVVILAGRDEVGDEVAEPEVWSPSGGIRQLTNASLVLPYYPRTFVAPNGQVFYAGEEQTTRYLNTSGTGSWTTVGDRLYGARSYGAAVMYEAGKILYAGGGRTTNTAEIIDLNVAGPTWRWTGSMAVPRRHLNATVLPTGEVLVTGGTTSPIQNDVSQAVRSAEIWNPATGVWTTLASGSVRRAYHSTSLLLPDGRVLHAGSGDAEGQPNEFSGELFSPPYLSRGARPTVSDAPTQLGYGTDFRVATPDAADIAKVSLIRLGSTTHAFDMNTRLLWLSFTRDASGLTISAPAGGTIAPPGHYMLFLVNQAGVPSIGRITKVSATSEPGGGPNAPPTAAFLAGCAGMNCTFADRSSDPDGDLTAWQWTFGDGDGTPVRDPYHAYTAPGTYTVTLTTKDHEDAAATISRQVTVPGPQTALGLTVTTRTETTKHISDLVWSRAQGERLYLYRNGLVLNSTPNDGKQSVSKVASGSATYIFKVCEAASTICSNPVTAVFGGGSPVDNSSPNAAFTPICSGSTCRFSDGSADPDGTVSSWQWNFGDGSSSTQRNPSHTFGAGGTFSVTLSVTDDRGARGSATRNVTLGEPEDLPPSPAFTSTCTGLNCTFTDESQDPDGNVTAWHWDFGDGSTSEERNAAHTYAGNGTYVVALTVRDDEGLEATLSKQVSAGDPPANVDPVANFGVSCTNLACTFTDQSTDQDGTLTAWSWAFGDGATSTLRNPNRTYASAGTRTVTLTVTDDRGGQAQRSTPVTVTAPPPPTSITLTVTGKTDATKHYITHKWTGTTGTTVDFWRNGARINSTPNDGQQTTSFKFKGTMTWRVRICQAGSSTVCSPERTITLSN